MGANWPYSIAQAQAVGGERDQSFEWLNRAFKQRDSDMQFVRHDLLVRSVRTDPRYKSILRRMNLPE